MDNELRCLHIENDIIPESLDWCKYNYTPPVIDFINCKDFGHCDGMNGNCIWCSEMTPYLWEMCSDETQVKSYMAQGASRECAIDSVKKYKYNIYINELENNLVSNDYKLYEENKKYYRNGEFKNGKRFN